MLELKRELRGGDRSGVRPLSLEEVHMAVPESGGDRQAAAVDDGGVRGNVRADRGDRFAIDQNYAVSEGFGVRIDVNRSADERRNGSIAIEVLLSLWHYDFSVLSVVKAFTTESTESTEL